MIDYSNISIEKIAIHQVGNKLRDEGCILSKQIKTSLSPEEERNFLNFFIPPFSKINEYYNFYHSSDLELNEIKKFSQEIFDSTSKFHKTSEKIAKLLYDYSVHPKVEAGELYVVLFNKCFVEDNSIEVIGIFKSESKETFIKLNKLPDHYDYSFETGTGQDNMNKGCLIYNTGNRGGYSVAIFDNSNKGDEAQYWRDNFLKLTPSVDEYHYTQNILTITKNYILTRMPDEYEVSKADKIDYLNRSASYFKNNDGFNEKNFLKEVFNDNTVTKSFRNFSEEFAAENNLSLSSNFDISKASVKKQMRTFKSVIKLDKNFHIYIHGNRDLIEQGYDTKTGKKFYKIYFDKET